jgi:two-component system LytT family response regulator
MKRIIFAALSTMWTGSVAIADVWTGTGSLFDGNRNLIATYKQTMIVFVTAYDQYALNAFETNAVDYLVKPVEKERLDKTIERLQARMNESLPAKNFSKVVAGFTTEKKMTRLAVRAGNKIEIIALSAISMINALDGYAEIFHGERKSLSDDTLDSLEGRLGPAFIRIYRSVIINLDFLKELTREGDRKYTAHLKDYYENSCPVSREALKKLQNRLGIV